MSRPYNGFTPAQRNRVQPIIDAAIARGDVECSRTCAICGSVPRRIVTHLEDYGNPLSFIPVCRSCHSHIHLRFWRGRNWWRAIPALPEAVQFLNALSTDVNALDQPMQDTYPNGPPEIFSQVKIATGC